ncbi:MarR family winged helix-turn-helix transcriptional regulator [Treponema pedis]|uniref:MarR family transcriptional regulator n=1 Tax=Treponema pedis str. T A4 TaxID=1291379 RepID=S5ZXM4_9SPIR|nr:MarR family transcriptional regulator [Treponema pedis]AGT45275.1 MarR family transcriptional regulator [Treponema pedis str. T A4]
MKDFPSEYKNDCGQSAGLLFMRTYNKWHGEIKKRLADVGITHPQFVVLTSIGYLSQTESEITQVMVSKISGMDVMSVSQVLGLLERAGFVLRKEHSKDTRAKSVSLTKDGVKVLKKAVPIVESIDKIFFDSLKTKKKEFMDSLYFLSGFKF